MIQSILRLTGRIYKTWPKKLRRPTPDTVEIMEIISMTKIEQSFCVAELRKDLEYETDENIPSFCMCLDWFLQKIGCRGNQELVNTDQEVYRRNDQERF